MTLPEFLALFPDEKGARKKAGKGWNVRCPAHADGRPSLHVAHGDNGGIVLHCYAGCEPDAIVAALGITMHDLFADPPDYEQAPPPFDRLVCTYDYVNLDGETVYSKLRFASKTFQWRPHGIARDQRIPYRWPELVMASGRVFLCEGEKDADNLAAAGAVATTFGGAEDWQDRFTAFFHQRDVVILPDNDEPGEKFAQRAQLALSRDLRVRSARIVRLPVPSKGDVSDWLAGGGTALALHQLCDADPSTSAIKVTMADDVPELIHREAARPRITTPWPQLDARLGLMRAGFVYLFQAPTGGGKTSLAAQMAADHATRGPVVFWTGELSPEQIGARIVSQQAGVSWRDVLDGHANGQSERILRHLHLAFAEGPAVEAVAQALERLRRRTGGTPLIIVDYAQLAAAASEQIRTAVIYVMRQLQALAHREGAVVVTLSQPNRAGARLLRDGTSDSASAYVDVGGESGALEQTAAGVVSLVFDPTEDKPIHDVVAVVAKVRLGQAGPVAMQFDGARGTWSESGGTAIAPARRRRRDELVTILREAEIAGSVGLTRNQVEKIGRNAGTLHGKRTEILRDINALVSEGIVRELPGGLLVLYRRDLGEEN